MFQYRNIVIVILLCAIFVSGSALIRASGYVAEERLRANAADSLQAYVPPRTLVTEERFYATTTAPTVNSTANALPQTPTPPRPPADSVTADSYIVGDVSTGKIYIEKNGLAVLPFASMSKLITAIAATDERDLLDTVTISTSSTEVSPDASNLRPNEKFTIGELMYPMLMNSSNVAAEALSSSQDRSKFLESMSGYAWEIGMPGSYFADPTGISPRNAGTARGFFAMARYIFDKRPDILAITRIQELKISTSTDHGAHTFTNIHPFVTDPRFLGGKTGRTPEALETMLTIMKIKDHPIAIIIMRSDGVRARDTNILINRIQNILE